MAGATKENIPGGSSTEEQRSQTAFSPKTLRAAGLLSVAGVGSFLTARCGDARNSPPWPQPKSLAAAPLVVSKQALRVRELRIAVDRLGENSKEVNWGHDKKGQNNETSRLNASTNHKEEDCSSKHDCHPGNNARTEHHALPPNSDEDVPWHLVADFQCFWNGRRLHYA